MRKIIVVMHNIRSSHNVGAMLRTADGLGVETVVFSGYTPYPKKDKDNRLPHLAEKINKQIQKTALGAIQSVAWEVVDNLEEYLKSKKLEGYLIVGLEQGPKTIVLPRFKPPDKMILILGNEIDGIDSAIRSLTDQEIEIPMLGNKESFNVTTAAAMAIYHCRFFEYLQ